MRNLADEHDWRTYGYVGGVNRRSQISNAVKLLISSVDSDRSLIAECAIQWRPLLLDGLENPDSQSGKSRQQQ